MGGLTGNPWHDAAVFVALVVFVVLIERWTRPPK